MTHFKARRQNGSYWTETVREEGEEGRLVGECEMEMWKDKKKKKRGNNRDKKSEEEEECVGSAPSLKDDSQLSLSTSVTRNEPRLVKWKKERERKKPSLPPFCYAVAIVTKALSSGLLARHFHHVVDAVGKKEKTFLWRFSKTSQEIYWVLFICFKKKPTCNFYWIWPTNYCHKGGKKRTLSDLCKPDAKKLITTGN